MTIDFEKPLGALIEENTPTRLNCLQAFFVSVHIAYLHIGIVHKTLEKAKRMAESQDTGGKALLVLASASIIELIASATLCDRNKYHTPLRIPSLPCLLSACMSACESFVSES